MNSFLDIHAVGFSLGNAIASVEASRRAYSEEPTIHSDLNHILVVEQDDAVLVAFRGTAGFKDFMTDGKFWLDDHIHAGFAEAHRSTISQLVCLLSRTEAKPVLLAGHSLGGALAVLAADTLCARFDVRGVYTFGQPRVGDIHFSTECQVRFGNRHWRFVNQEDIIPRLPLYLPYWLHGAPGGFRHSGQEVFFDSLGRMRFGSPLWMKILSDLFGTYLEFKNNNAIAQMADHAVANYERKINEH